MSFLCPQVLGTQIDVIISTEDRDLFNKKMQQINEKIAEGYPADDAEEAVRMATKIG